MEAVVASSTEGVVRILLGKLGDVLASRYARLSGVRGEVQELKDELESINSCLADHARNAEDHREQMRTWMKQLREVAYDAEDCVDMFCHHLSESPGDSRGLASHIHRIAGLLRTLRVRNKLATEIQILKSRALMVSERRQRYKLDAAEANNLVPPDNMLASSSHADVDRQLPALQNDESRLVGIARNKENVIGLLENDDVHLRVISIVGFGGLGKTTLAMSVYSSSQVSGIQTRAFMTVSRAYDLQSILQSVLRELLPRPIQEQGKEAEEDPLHGVESWHIKKLIARSKQHLQDKRYLVILDDIWPSTAWEQLKAAFPDNEKGSRIIVTTRSGDVARSCSSPNGDVYKMKALTEPESNELLCRTVFRSKEIPSAYNHLKTKKMEEVCKTIFKKSGGLPLAIVSIAGMLAQRKTEPVENWERTIERIPYELQKDNISEGMRRILSVTFSYNDLPYHLKTCFLYLSVFPEDHEIRRGPLIRRWEAEGFISEVHSLSSEDIAKDYFDGFVSRNLVIPEQLASNGEINSFKVHDIMLDIITAKSIQENVMLALGAHLQSTLGHDTIRRLSIQPGRRDEYILTRSLDHVRSLTIMGSIQKPKDITFRKLKLLRVLDLEGCHWSLTNQDWNEICKLSLLRYLSIRKTETERLPSNLGKLKALVTLDVRQTKVTDLPQSITQLQNLQHLLAGAYVYYTRTHSVKHFDNDKAVKIPPGLSKMNALKRISFVDVEKSGLKALHEVARLSRLTRLCAMQTNPRASWENFDESLSELSNSLRYLSIMHTFDSCRNFAQLAFLERIRSPPFLLHSLHLVGGLGRLPSWVQHLTRLATISLRHNDLGPEIVDELGRLPSLVSLKLYHGAYEGTELSFKSHQFPMLKYLVIDNLPRLVKLSFESGALANLEELTLMYLANDASIKGFQSLKKLRKVELFSINYAEVVSTVKREAESHQNKPIVTIE